MKKVTPRHCHRPTRSLSFLSSLRLPCECLIQHAQLSLSLLLSLHQLTATSSSDGKITIQCYKSSLDFNLNWKDACEHISCDNLTLFSLFQRCLHFFWLLSQVLPLPLPSKRDRMRVQRSSIIFIYPCEG